MNVTVAKWFKGIALFLGIFIFCVAALLAWFFYVLDDTQKSHLLSASLTSLSHATLESGQLTVSYQDGTIEINAGQLTWHPQQESVTVEIEQAEITIPLQSLLRPPLFLSSLALKGVTVDLSTSPVNDLFARMTAGDGFITHLLDRSTLHIQNGSIRLPHTLQLTGLEFSSTLEADNLRHIRLSSMGWWRDRSTPVTLQGSIDSFSSLDVLQLVLTMGPLDIGHLTINDQLMVDRGSFSIQSHISLTPDKTPLTINNELDLTNLHVSLLSSTAQKTYQFNHLTAQLTTLYTDGLVTLQPSSLINDTLDLSLSGTLDLKPPSPVLSLHLAGREMVLDDFRKLLPDPLLDPWLSSELFPLFSQGRALLNDLTLKGSLAQLRAMDQVQNRHVLHLDLLLADTTISLRKPDILFSGSSARLQISNGVLDITDIQGTFHQTTVQAGSYRIDNLYADEFTSRFGGNCTSTLEDLAHLSSVSFFPDQVQQNGPFLRNASGQVQATIRGFWGPDSENIRFDQLDVTIKEIRSKGLFRGSPVLMETITIQKGDHSGNILSGSGQWQKNQFTLSGFFQDDMTGELTIRSNIDRSTLQPFLQESHLPFESTDNGETFPVSVTIKSRDHSLLLDGRFALPTLSMISCTDTCRPLSNGSLTLKLTIRDRHRLSIDDFSIGYPPYQIQGSGTGNLEEMKLKMTLRGNTEKKKSPLQADLSLLLDLEQPEQSQLSGTIKGSGLTLSLPGLLSPAKDVRFDLLFSEDRVDIRQFDFFLNHSPDTSPVQIQGILKKATPLQGSLLVKTDYLRMDDIFTSDPDNEQPSEAKGEHLLTGEEGILISARAETLDMNGAQISPFLLQGYLANSNFYSISIAAQLENGRFGMMTTPDTTLEKTLQFCFYLEDQELKGIHHLFPHLDDLDLKGTISTGGLLQAQGKSYEELRSRLNGEIAFHVQETTVKGDFVLARILERLSLEKLFSKETAQVKDDELYIKSITGNLSVNNSIMTSDDLFIDTFAFDASGDVQFNLNNRTVQSNLAVSPFGTVDTIISTIPIIGHILTGKDKSLVSYHFEISGKASDPEVRYIPLTNIPESLLGYGKRLLSPLTYLPFLAKSQTGLDYDTASRELILEISKNLDAEFNSWNNLDRPKDAATDITLRPLTIRPAHPSRKETE